jgi:DNA-binding SARP family transcriptional activator/tetratricopeptide (TPR) repeat protein
VVGLHIHAASYFETTEQWPEAIHHYLRAGLQRQAARLIAKYGEEVVAEGRLGLVDEWLQQLPDETIKQNARLSLLYGEACGIRGDWDRALEALERARTYFARKGDRRLEALACLKLSSVYSNYGDTDSAAQAAEAGVELVPSDDIATRLRLEGNLAITRTWLSEPLEAVVRECQRIAVEAASRGLEHFAAIAHHNAGGVLMQMGRLSEAVSNLERAARFWSDPPTSPFADNTDLVLALLATGGSERARAIASDAIRRTEPWPRPLAHARYGLASVHVYDERYEAAVNELTEAKTEGTVAGGMLSIFAARLVEALYLAKASAAQIRSAATDLDATPQDPRYAAETIAARAIAVHVGGLCRGECIETLGQLQEAEGRGEILTVALARLKIGSLAIEHRPARFRVLAWDAARDVVERGLGPLMKAWLRRYASLAAARWVLKEPDGSDLLARIADADPDGWRSTTVEVLGYAPPNHRRRLLTSVFQHANRQTVAQLRSIPGSDVDETRRRLQHLQAARLFVRTFGNIGIHRASWSGPEIRIEKKRVRALVGVLAAHARDPLSRDAVIDLLWPEADGDSAINNLNQTVFQLRRYLDPQYRGGDSPEYVLSTSEQVSLSNDLVHTDLAELERLPARIAGADWQHRQATVSRILDLIRGEFLNDLRYEDWASRLQLPIHADVRRLLLPIAQAGPDAYETDLSIRAATTLLRLDAFDEAAVLALASAMAQSGKRVAARGVVVEYVKRIRNEFDDEPSSQFVSAAGALGASDMINGYLTSVRNDAVRG